MKKLLTFASASALSLVLIAVLTVANDRGGFLSAPNLLDIGRERVSVRDSASASQGSGCLPTTGTVSGLTFAQGVNSALAALISSNSGASAPATDCSGAPVKGQVWLDTSVIPNLLKQYDGASWVVIGAIDATNHLWAPPVGGGTAAVTAASTADICANPAAVQIISGTTTITSFGSSCVPGVRKTLIFSAATPITYNAISMILPGQRSYTAAVGDVADAIYLGSGNWRVASITKIDGSSVTNPAVPLGTVLYGDYGTPPAKTLFGAGQAISRASYPDYLAAVTRTQSGTLTAGNNTITSVSNTAGLGAGMPLEGTGIQAGTTILSVTSSTIVMSNTATANGSQQVTAFITGYGSGGDSTTVGVKDCRGRTLAGRDDMLGTPANRLTSSYFGASAARIGATGGSESHTLTAAQIPAHTHPNTLNDPGHDHGVSGGIYGGTTSGTSSGPSSSTPLGFGAIDIIPNTTGITINNAANTGGGGAHPIVQPTIIAECVVVVLP